MCIILIFHMIPQNREASYTHLFVLNKQSGGNMVRGVGKAQTRATVADDSTSLRSGKKVHKPKSKTTEKAEKAVLKHAESVYFEKETGRASRRSMHDRNAKKIANRQIHGTVDEEDGVDVEAPKRKSVAKPKVKKASQEKAAEKNAAPEQDLKPVAKAKVDQDSPKEEDTQNRVEARAAQVLSTAIAEPNVIMEEEVPTPSSASKVFAKPVVVRTQSKSKIDETASAIINAQVTVAKKPRNKCAERAVAVVACAFFLAVGAFGLWTQKDQLLAHFQA
jgi:hypothetical protein